MKRSVFVAFVLAIVLGPGCDKLKNPTTPTPVADVQGCTTSNATNYNSTATKDNGTCTFSNTVFYVTAPPQFGNFPINVLVNGQLVGTITAVYPTPPGNCRADGTAQYQLKDGKSHDWNVRATPFTPTSLFSLNAGTFVADRSTDCVKVRVF